MASPLSSIHIFSSLTNAEASQAQAHLKYLELKKKEILINRGDRLSGMYGLLYGKLKIYILTCSGQEKVIRIIQPGDSFGEAIMFNNIPSPIHVEALSNSKVLSIPKEQVIQLLEHLPNFSMTMLSAMSFLLTELLEDLETCCIQSAVQRIASFLNDKTHSSHPELELPATKATTASLINLTAESFSRGLHQLTECGVILVDKRIIRVQDPDLLNSIALGQVNCSELTSTA